MAYISKLEEKDIRDLLHAGVADVPGSEASLFQHAQKISINPHKRTLIIGIGGTGTKAINRIKHYLNNRSENFRDNIALLAIDSDTTEFDKAGNLMPNETALISVPPATASSLLNIAANRTELVKSWINPEFFVQFDTKGANQIRQSGLAKLYTQNTAGLYVDAYLKTKISEASAKLAPSVDGTRSVYLITGISGGTGSGTFNDIAMITKDALGSTCEITGVFFLPDTVDQYATTDAETKNMHANGYAALKELNYYVGQSQRDGYTDIHTPTYAAPESYNHMNPLYKNIFLFSGSPTGVVSANRSQAAFDSAVESLINLLAAQASTNEHGEAVHFSDSFLSNAQTGIATQISSAIDTSGKERAGYFLEANFAYSATGVASASIPEETCTSYLISKTISSMYSDNDSTSAAYAAANTSYQVAGAIGKPSIPETAATTKIMSLFGITTGSSFNYTVLTNMIKAATTFSIDSNVDVSSLMTKDQVIANNHQVLAPMINYPIKKSEVIAAVEERVASMFADFRFKALAFIKEYGPQAFVDLYDGKGPDGMPFESVPGLKKAIALDKVVAPNPSATDGSLTYENNLRAEADKRLPVIKVHVASVSDYVRIYLNWQSALLYEEIWDFALKTSDVNNAVTRLLITPIEQFAESCRDLATILKEVSNIYSNLSTDFTKEDFTNSNDSSTNVNLIRDDSSFDWAKSKLDTIVKKIDMSELIEKIVDDYFGSNSKEWALTVENGMQTCNARERFDSILAEQVRKANDGKDVSISVVDYLQHLQNSGKNYEQYANQIAPILVAQSQPMLNRDPALPPLNPLRQCYALFPESILNSPDGAAIKTAFTTALSSAANTTVKIFPSTEVDKITFYTLECGHPLYVLKDLAKWEASYNESNHRLIHRNESGTGDFNPETGLAWVNYPHCRTNFDARQVNVDPSLKDVKSMEYIYLTTNFDATIQKALDYGILRREGDRQNGYYYRFYNISVPGWDLSLDTYTEEEHHHPKMRDALVDFLIRNNNNGALVSKKVELINAAIFTAPRNYQNDLDAERIPLDRAKRVLRVNVKMYLELKKSIAIYETFGPWPNEGWAIDVFRDLVSVGLINNKDKDTIYILNNGSGKPEVLLNTSPALRLSWSKTSKHMFENGMVYGMLFQEFFKKYNTDTALVNLEEKINETRQIVIEDDPSGETIMENLKGFIEETRKMLEMMEKPTFARTFMSSAGLNTTDEFNKLHLDLVYSTLSDFI